jgi:protein-S-isoprenylcysteine O-methyltransferase Ste14
MPTLWLLVAIVVQAALQFLLPLPRVIPVPWNLLGAIPVALGVILNLVADRAFHEAGTTVKPFEESSALLTGGVFRITRNPMYLGFALILLGIALLLTSLWPLLVVVGFAVLMDRAYIRVEERMLAARFGDGWQRYRSKTRRWL